MKRNREEVKGLKVKRWKGEKRENKKERKGKEEIVKDMVEKKKERRGKETVKENEKKGNKKLEKDKK